MLSLPPSVRVFLCTRPTDMRRGFDGLAQMTVQYLREDPYSGHLFVFSNRRQDRLKILYWDRDGYALWYKRLERGTFRLPRGEEGGRAVSSGDLLLLLDGVDLQSVKRQKRYRRKE